MRPFAVHLPELHSFISTYGSSSIADKHMNVKEEEEEQEYRKSSTMDEDCGEDNNFTASDDDLSVDRAAVGKRSQEGYPRYQEASFIRLWQQVKADRYTMAAPAA